MVTYGGVRGLKVMLKNDFISGRVGEVGEFFDTYTY
jgi:hypothetical protein